MIHVNTLEQVVDRCYEGGGRFSPTFSLLEMEVLYNVLSRQHATKNIRCLTTTPTNRDTLMNAMTPSVHFVQGHHGV